MSAIIGETPRQEPRDSALTATDDVELAASFPLSITLWVYFDELPGESDTQIVFWYGEALPLSNHIRLEATRNGTAGIDLTAILGASAGTVSATATQVPLGTWTMATVIVEQIGGASHGVTLYIDDVEEDSQTGSVGTTAPTDYDTFLLGANHNSSNFGRFRVEHVAIWEPVGDPTPRPLSASEIQELFEERWAPITPPEVHSIDRNPGIAYWMLVGHWSAGIDAESDQNLRNRGTFWNQANPATGTAKPQLTMLEEDKPVVWSAKTPVMRYKTPEQPMAPGPVVHPPIPPVSRLQPLFYVFNTSGDLGTFKYGPLEVPIYTHPNFIPKAVTRSSNANTIVPLVSTLTDYLPHNDLALVARRMADFFEFTGLTRGVGSVGDGLYEGYVIILGLGLGDVQGEDKDKLRGFRGTLETPVKEFTGTNVQIPLELHPLDRVEATEEIDPNWPWHTWFNAHGTRLVKDYMDGFWTAFKRELDERDLCYPRVLWWDQEDWAAATRAVQSVQIDPGPPEVREARGTFTLQLGDARASTEPLMANAALTTLDGIYNTTGPAYYDLKIPTHDDNQPWQSWYLGWSIAIGQQSMLDAMMAKAKELFPLSVWSNYDRHSADSPDFRYQGNTQRQAYNTPPADEAEIHGDYSSPKLYTPGSLDKLTNASNRLMPELGVTYSQVMRNCHRSRIDACVNAFSEKRLAPYFEMGSRPFPLPAPSEERYDLTDEDAFDVLAYAWKRGVTDFIPFVWEGQISEDEEADPGDSVSPLDDDGKKLAHDRMYDVCFRLLDTVHWLPQENHARACRVSRRGW